MFKSIPSYKKLFLFILPLLLALLVFIFYRVYSYRQAELKSHEETVKSLNLSLLRESDMAMMLEAVRRQLSALKNEDQYLVNKNLDNTIKAIEASFTQAVKEYENLLDLKNTVKKTDELDSLFADALDLLADRQYVSASAVLKTLSQKIKTSQQAAATVKIPENLPMENAPPASGYRRQKVQAAGGAFMVDIVTADLNSARVVVDTASDKDCANDCPVMALADYVSRNGAFAGINGSYFCPASYPSCADKKNSFDTLLMNKNKYYFNSGNNVYSTVPAAIFYGNTARFVGQSLEWGRDTGVDAVIANRPLLTVNGQSVFGGDSDQKQSAKGGRSFVGANGSTVYIGVVHSATVAESSQVLQTMGISNALNLDDGGSTALWFGGYKAGPGRNIPNAVLLVRK